MGILSGAECVNILVKRVYLAMHDVLSGERKSGKMSPRMQSWSYSRADIEQRFSISSTYFRSLSKMDRPLDFPNFLGVLHWLESMVREEERTELKLLVLHMLRI